MSRPAAAALVALACACACAPAPAPAPAGPRDLALPSEPGSLAPFLDVGPEGRLHAVWLDPLPPSGHALRFATRSATGWSDPVTIASGPRLLANWADTPTLRDLGGDRLAVSWPVKRSGGHAYDLAIALSADGGSRWTAPITPHSDDTDTEHGFPAFGPGDETGVTIAWLDGRDYAEREPPAAAMALRAARVGPDGTVEDERVLDSRTCDCCPIASADLPTGFALVYRDRSEGGEVRDIALLRQEASAWLEPAIVHPDGWEIAGCPVNGPAVDAAGQRLAVAWFTAAGGLPAAWAAFSTDGGEHFGTPIRFDEGSPSGSVSLVLLEGGDAAVSWVEAEELRIRRLGPDGPIGPVQVAAALPPGRAAGMPRLVAWGAGLAVAWTSPGEPGAVRVAELPTPPR